MNIFVKFAIFIPDKFPLNIKLQPAKLHVFYTMPCLLLYIHKNFIWYFFFVISFLLLFRTLYVLIYTIHFSYTVVIDKKKEQKKMDWFYFISQYIWKHLSVQSHTDSIRSCLKSEQEKSFSFGPTILKILFFFWILNIK